MSAAPARRALFEHLAAALLLAAFVAALFGRLLFTNRVLATGDILLYFYPYREFAAAALRAGDLPLWNPYVFLGAPFLANPQAAVLYPLHWPLAWLSVTQQVYWSAAVHAWLFGYGGYWLLRRWGCGLLPGLAAALALAGSGYLGGQIGHLNQLNGAAWLPWAVLLVTPFAAQPLHRAAWLARAVLLGIIVALMLLAGHTQTTYINLFGVGLWALAVALLDLDAPARGLRARFRFRPAPLLAYAGGVALGAALSAAQLLPTLELSGLGLRGGGLSYLDATSFSLKPLQLPWTLLPTYGLLEAGALFDTPAYTEFIAYVGVVGLALAALGAWRGRGAARAFGLLFALLGLFLAAGRWNPLYALLYWAVPGFDLFRAPARWLLLYTLGAGVLAGVGLDALAVWLRARRIPAVDDRRSEARDRTASVPPVIHPTAGAVACVALLALDLLLAALALPHAHPTAPEAVYGLRTAPAHLLTDPDRAAPGPASAAAGRFLGMSSITYDPGDMADLERIYRSGDHPALSQRAFDDLIVALKVQELVVPNLAMLRRIPAVDGYDGGVLPLQRYNLLAQVLVPPADLVPDGRLREQIAAMPSTAQLNLFNAQHVITDKVRDLWHGGVYYDRQIGARLTSVFPSFTLDIPAPFSATHLDLIAAVEGDAAALSTGAEPVASVAVTGTDGITRTLSLIAGGAPGAQLANAALDSPLAASSGAEVAYRDVDGGRQEYRVRLDLGAPMTPAAIEIARGDTALDVVVQAATLFDERTGMFLALLPSDRGRFRLAHSGDVKIYENLDLLPRAWLVSRTLPAAAPQDALRLLQTPGFDPAQAAVIEGDMALDGSPAPGDRAEIVAYTPERVEIRTRSASGALLVLADAYYPGWSATVDGAPAPVHPTNVLLRGVHLSPGEHTVVFTFEPGSLVLGAAISGGALLLSALLLLTALLRLRGGARHGV